MDLENIRYRYFSREIFVLGQKAAGVRGFNNVQDYYTIQKQCLESGKLFEDPEFPPTGNWLRPHEICKNLGIASPQFFVDSVSRFDIKQGRLGDCWFLAAMAPLTSSKLMINQIVCKDNSFDENYAGIFHFRFWVNGKFVEVVVDDRLPVNQFGQLNCLRSNEPNEFWSALLEKAYAKLFGGYEALDGGLPYEAFEDFTGGISEIFDLKTAPKNLFEIMGVAVRRGSMMACSVNPDPNIREAVLPNGLVQGHAYSVTGVKTVDVEMQGDKYSIDLIRLRNPWGQGEWKGSWSDDSVEWKMISEDQKKELGITIEQDGEFWMSYQDFISYYERLDICNVSPHSLHDDKRKENFWDRKFYDGAWVKGSSAGGCRNHIDTFHTNPQYVMTLKNADETDPKGRCNVLIALMQKNGRSKEKGSHYVPMGFSVYRIQEQHLDQVPLKNEFFRYNGSIEQTTFVNSRGITARYKLEPGHYLIVPSTFYQNVEAEFLLRVCTEKNEAFDWEEFEKYREKNKDNKRRSKFTPSFKPCKPEDFLPSNNMSDNESETKDPAVSKDQPSVKPAVKEPTEMQLVEKLFKDAAGSKEEIDWMELKAILDGSIPKESRVKGIYSDYKNDGFSRDICRSIIAMMDTDYSRKLKLDEFKKFYATFIKWRVWNLQS
ncbi:hypothetical protein ACKWTF_009370 [Chironomus riparius]